MKFPQPFVSTHSLRRSFSALLFVFLFSIHAYLRLFELEDRIQFTWDQVQNAWVMKEMLIGGAWPLVGMIAKQNAGFFVGPAYYYLLAPFYALFHLDPIAGGFFAACVSTVTFLVLFFVTKRLFSEPVAFMSVFFYAVSATSIAFDRIPWPVVLIPVVSLLVFYLLYRAVTFDAKALISLGFVLGFSYHVHFSSVFYIPILLFAVPLLPRTRKTLISGAIGFLFAFLWFLPVITAGVVQNVGSYHNFFTFIGTYYHGLHLRRIMQLFGDAFIQYETILSGMPIARYGVMILILFGLAYVRRNMRRDRVILLYFVSLWFAVPWLTMSLYGGEISSYYFSITRPLVFMSLGYLCWFIYEHSPVLFHGIVLFALGWYGLVNYHAFYAMRYTTLPKYREEVWETIARGDIVEFKEGNSMSYLYWLYTQRE